MPFSQINQLVSEASVSSLLDGKPAPLHGWYAAPLTKEHAGALHQAAQQAIQAQLRAGESCFQQRLLLLACCDGSAAVNQARHGELVPVAANRYEHALLELVYGQWLASRKLLPAMRHLSDGFRLAAPLLASGDYFRLLRRHERLACLAFSTQAACPRDLPALLIEAAVIERLRQGVRCIPANSHCDTLG